jgi:hypothetical protein
MERELLGLLEGGWALQDEKGAAYRKDWLCRTREAATAKEASIQRTSLLDFLLPCPKYFSLNY